MADFDFEHVGRYESSLEHDVSHVGRYLSFDPAISAEFDHDTEVENPLLGAQLDHIATNRNRLTFNFDHRTNATLIIAAQCDHRTGVSRGVFAELDHDTRSSRWISAKRDHDTTTTGKIRAVLDHRLRVTLPVAASLDHVAQVAEFPPKGKLIVLGPDLGEPYIPEPESVEGLVNPNILNPLRPWVRAKGPWSSTAKVATATLTRTINGGWTGDLGLIGIHPIELADGTTCRIEMCDGRGNRLQSPPLVIEAAHREWGFGGPVSQYTLLDETSYKLSQTGRSLPTFLRTTSRAIANAVAEEWEVPINRAPNFPILEEDIKDSSGWDPLLRLAAVDASVIVVDNSGQLLFVPNRNVTGQASLRFTRCREGHLPSQLYTGFQCVKTTSIAGQTEQQYRFTEAGFASFALKYPIRAPFAQDRSVVGGLTYLSLFTDQPSAEGSQLVAFFLLGGTPVTLTTPVGNRGAVVRHATITVVPELTNPNAAIDARLHLTGAHPEPDWPGTERAFTLRTGTGGRKTKTWREQLLPTKSFVQARLSRYLWEASKKHHPIDFEGACDLSVDLFQDLQYGSPSLIAANQIGTVTHSFSAGSIPTTKGQAYKL